MLTSKAATPLKIQVGSAQVHLFNVILREDLTLDEVHLQGAEIAVETLPGEKDPRITADETRFQAIITEPNLNRLLEANLPPDFPLRNLRVAVLSGKVRISGQFVKIISIPLTLEGTPRLENGVRVSLDWQGINAKGIPLPGALVELLQQQLNKSLDLTKLSVPLWLDEIRCEPGRLTVSGRARLAWPLVAMTPSVVPFAAREAQPLLEDTPLSALPAVANILLPAEPETKAVVPLSMKEPSSASANATTPTTP